MSESTIINKHLAQTSRTPNQERIFDLSLPVMVKGVDASGNEFQERTELNTISSQLATFWIDSGVTIGSKLDLCLEVPKTIILEQQIRLLLSGDVIFVKADSQNHKKHLISVRLDKNYKIHSNRIQSNNSIE